MIGAHDARLVPAAGAAWAASWAAASRGEPWSVACAGVLLVAALAGAVLLDARHGRPTAAMLVLPAIAALAATSVGVAERVATACDVQVLAAASQVRAEVVVQDEPHVLEGGSRRWLVPATITAWAPGTTADLPDRCALRSGAAITVELGEEVERGDRLVVVGTVTPSARGEAMMWRARLAELHAPGMLLQWRRSFAVAASGVPPQVQGLVRGMVTGDTTAMAATQIDQMRTAGLAHLTAVSGAHFAVLIAALGAVLTASRSPRPVRAAAVLTLAAGFATVVGEEASVLRALAMATAVARGLAWGRPARGLPALAAGVLVLALVRPGIVTKLGFAMSVAAVAAIVLWSPAVARMLARRLAPGLARVVSVPIVAQAAVTPLVLVMEPGLTPYAVPANLIAGLAVPPVMALGALAFVVSPVSTDVAALLAQAAGWAARPIAWVAEVTAQAPLSRLAWPEESPGVALAALVVVAGIVATAGIRWAPVRAAAAVIALLGVAVGLLLGAVRSAPALAQWDVVACDVGQGDMLLVRAGPTSAVVIDTGPDGDLARECLRRHGVRTVPLLVLTHPHADHDGAVTAVLSAASVGAAWISATGTSGAAEAALLAAGVPVDVPAAHARAVAGTVSVRVLSSLHLDPSVEANDASIVVAAETDGASVLALGDLEEAGQRSLLTILGEGITVDAVKVAHHGSATQLDALEPRIDAKVALVSVGADNAYGHPAASALGLYSHDRVLLRTDVCGSVGLARDETGLRWSQCPTDMAR